MDWEGKEPGNKAGESLNWRGGKKFAKKLLAVVGSRAVVEDGLAVGGGAVAFVVKPAVVRVLTVEVDHVLITGDFGQDGGGGNGVALGVAVCDGGDLGGNQKGRRR